MNTMLNEIFYCFGFVSLLHGLYYLRMMAVRVFSQNTAVTPESQNTNLKRLGTAIALIAFLWSCVGAICDNPERLWFIANILGTVAKLISVVVMMLRKSQMGANGDVNIDLTA